MSFAVVSSLYPHTRSTALEESIMTATYTFDVFSSLDGYGSYGPPGDWGGYWGKQGPELLEHRLDLFGNDQRMVFGATTFRQFVQMLATSTEESEVRDPWVTRMTSMPATVVSSTLEGPLDWPDATVVSGDAVDVVARLKEESEVPLRSHGSLSMNRALCRGQQPAADTKRTHQKRHARRLATHPQLPDPPGLQEKPRRRRSRVYARNGPLFG